MSTSHKDIPEGYTYKRCDQYSAKEFLKMFQGKKAKETAQNYLNEHPKEVYDTDDEIAVLDILKSRVVQSLSSTRHSWTTKRTYYTDR